MKFLVGSNVKNEMSRIASAGKFDAAIAYWGGGVTDLLDFPSDMSGTRIVCDAFSGACNPTTLRELIQRGANVNFLDGLHAKVMLSGDGAIVSSANASSNGLAFEADEIDFGLEAVVSLESEEAEHIAIWLEKIFARSSSLTIEDLERVEPLCRMRRNARPAGSRGSLKNAITRGDSTLHDRRFFVAVTVPDDPTEEVEEKYAESAFGRERQSSDEEVPYFWDARGWRCKTGDVILSFEWDEDEEAYVYDNLWEVQGLIDRGFIVPLAPIKTAFGLKMTKADGRSLAKKVTRIVEKGEIDGETNLLPIERFMSLLSGDSD